VLKDDQLVERDDGPLEQQKPEKPRLSKKAYITSDENKE